MNMLREEISHVLKLKDKKVYPKKPKPKAKAKKKKKKKKAGGIITTNFFAIFPQK
jgi:hypothetical protein